jgi:ubiquinone/menaquinone biosynthesis C-methylase UbiE
MLIDKIKTYFKKRIRQDSYPWKILLASYRFAKKLTFRPDYNSEYAFWDNALPGAWKEFSSRDAWEKIVPSSLIRYIVDKREHGESNLKLLEIGSGPVSILAWLADQRLCEVVAVDPLAEAYNGILSKHNYSYPIRPVEGHGEKLLKLFAANSFDIVYASNALDHAGSPKLCLDNMYQVVKDNGIIVLEGHTNEGTRAEWLGLHKHDLSIENGQLLCRDKSGKAINLTENLNLECIYQETLKAWKRGCGTPFVRPTDDDWFTIIFQKRDVR